MTALQLFKPRSLARLPGIRAGTLVWIAMILAPRGDARERVTAIPPAWAQCLPNAPLPAADGSDPAVAPADRPNEPQRPSVSRPPDLQCLATAEAGEVDITTTSDGCVQHGSAGLCRAMRYTQANVHLHWSANLVDLSAVTGNLGGDTHLATIRTSEEARGIAGRLAQALAPPDAEDHLCETHYASTIRWSCGGVSHAEAFQGACGSGPTPAYFRKAERLDKVARDLLSGDDLTHIQWPAD